MNGRHMSYTLSAKASNMVHVPTLTNDAQYKHVESKKLLTSRTTVTVGMLVVVNAHVSLEVRHLREAPFTDGAAVGSII